MDGAAPPRRDSDTGTTDKPERAEGEGRLSEPGEVEGDLANVEREVGDVECELREAEREVRTAEGEGREVVREESEA